MEVLRRAALVPRLEGCLRVGGVLPGKELEFGKRTPKQEALRLVPLMVEEKTMGKKPAEAVLGQQCGYCQV